MINGKMIKSPNWKIIVPFLAGFTFAAAGLLIVLDLSSSPGIARLENEARIFQAYKELQGAPGNAAKQESFRSAFEESGLAMAPPSTAGYTPARGILHVGQAEGDLSGSTEKVIQAAIDHVANLGGGTVLISGGEYVLRDSIKLRSFVTLKGSGDQTVLKKAAGATSRLTRSLDWYENHVEVEDATGFAIGDGVIIQERKGSGGGLGASTFARNTVADVQGNTLILKERVGKNFRLNESTKIGNLYSLIEGTNIDGARVEMLTLEGNREYNDFVDGNLEGALFLKLCKDVKIHAVKVNNFNGDGISVQACDRVTIEKSMVQGSEAFGVHVGSGSRDILIKDTESTKNRKGLFFCWGVTHSRVEGGQYSDNREFGMTIGRRDTDNRVLGALFERNGISGLEFRVDHGGVLDGPNRNVFHANVFRDNGGDTVQGSGIRFSRPVQDVTITQNRFENSDGGPQTTGILLDQGTQLLEFNENLFLNHDVEIDRSQSWKKRAKNLLGKVPDFNAYGN